MRIIFMGNPEVSSRVLDNLFKSKINLVGIVSNEPKRIGRGSKKRHTPVGKYAINNNLNLITTNSLEDRKFINKMSSLDPDLFIVVAYKLLPKAILDIPSIGSINLHASLLPKYRGASPIQFAIMNGDKKTGVTTFLIDEKIDHGKIIMQKEFDISKEDNYGSIIDKVVKAGSDILIDSIVGNQIGKNILSQDQANATFAPKISKKMYQIKWQESAENNFNKIRAFSPFPGAYSYFQNKRVKIFKAIILSGSANKRDNGIITINKNRVIVNCLDKRLELLSVQAEGKSKMDAIEWARGRNINTGNKFCDS